MGIPYGSWGEILPQCDVVSLHMPLLPSTKYFIDVSGGNAGACVVGVLIMCLGCVVRGLGGALAAAALDQVLYRRARGEGM